MYNFCFHIKPRHSIDEAWEELCQVGIVPAYSCEDEEGKLIYAFVADNAFLAALTMVDTITPVAPPETDWQSQWATHGVDYRDGYLHLQLPQPVRLIPGPGFGDLSHPTTRLVLKMMEQDVTGQHVVDIGCGSGVLSVAAIALGALSVDGIDIDPHALAHAKENAKLNHMEQQIRLFLPKEYPASTPERGVILMNMIRSEQQQAWKALPALHSLKGIAIVSGILATERDQYQEQCNQWGWKFLDEQEEEGWLGMRWALQKPG